MDRDLPLRRWSPEIAVALVHVAEVVDPAATAQAKLEKAVRKLLDRIPRRKIYSSV